VPTDEELTAVEAGALLGVHRSTLTRRAQFGLLPARKFGNVWVFRRSDLEAARDEIRPKPRLMSQTDPQLTPARTN